MGCGLFTGRGKHGEIAVVHGETGTGNIQWSFPVGCECAFYWRMHLFRQIGGS